MQRIYSLPRALNMKKCSNCKHLKYNEKELILARLIPTNLIHIQCKSINSEDREYKGSNVTYNRLMSYGCCSAHKPKST